MVVFGLKLMTDKAYRAERALDKKAMVGFHLESLDANAARDSADRHVERLLHNGVEVTILWAAIRDSGVEAQVRPAYDRLMPKEKVASS